MKILCVLALVGMATANVCSDASKPICTLGVSCEFANSEHPAHNCWSSMTARMQVIVQSDCDSKLLGSTAYWSFMENMENVCSEKNEPFTDCCNTCDFSGQVCWEMFPSMMQMHMTLDCNAAFTDLMAYNGLLANLNMLCHAKCLDELIPSACHSCSNIDYCAMEDEEHPTHECWAAMVPNMQAQLKKDCENSDQSAQFWTNIISVCEDKGHPAGPVSHCPCDICDFSDEPPVKQTCYADMVPQMQAQVTADCCSHRAAGTYAAFIQNMDGVCGDKGKRIFCPCQCKFEDYACFKVLPTMIQKAIVKQCLTYNLSEPDTGYWDFLDNLAAVCSMKCYGPMVNCKELKPVTE